MLIKIDGFLIPLLFEVKVLGSQFRKFKLNSKINIVIVKAL